MRLGLAGFGRMGAAAAKELSGAFPLVIWDAVPAALERAKAEGLATASGADELAQQSDAVLLFLPGPQEVRATVAGGEGLLAHLRPGSMIVDLSTVDPESTRRNAAEAAAVGVAYLDAPVLGRPQSAGKWTLPVGGDPDAFARIRPVLERIARRVAYVGPSGAGNAIKLLNNMMFAAINAITAEVMGICPKVGVDRRTFFDLVSGSGAATVSNLFLELGPKIVEEKWDPVFTVDLLHKDLSLGVQMAREKGFVPPVSLANLWLVETAKARKLGSLDSAAVVKVYDALYAAETSIE